MSDHEPPMNRQDFALANTLLNCSERPDLPVGEPAHPEEIALLVEGKAESVLGSSRVKQLFTQLDSDPALYQTWLQLMESQELDGEFTPQLESTHSQSWWKRTGWLDKLSAIAFPQPAFAVALVLCVLSSLVTWSAMRLTAPVQQPLVMADPRALDNKASLSSVGDHATQEVDLGTAIAGIMRCTPALDTTKPELCYTNTAQVQHWFLMDSTGVIPVPSPVAAEKIGGVKRFKNNILVEYVKHDQFALAYFSVKSTSPTFDLKLEYEDTIAEGYFDNVVLDDSGLRYERVQTDRETKQVTFPSGQ